MSKGGSILGLDIGVASIGWWLVETAEGRPIGTKRCGVHLFETGVEGGEAAMAQGKEASRAAARRDARAMRRQIWRRARRKRKLLRILQRHRLLPPGDVSTPLAIDRYLKELDQALAVTWNTGVSHTERVKFPYRLREAAVSRRLELYEIGRAIYHLAQRRGFLSNRKAPPRKGEDPGQVKAAIGDLWQKVRAHQPPYLGAYLNSLDPLEQRLRCRWTDRQMYLEEFDAIWREQAKHHALTAEARDEIRTAIFHQRPLKKQSHLIGRCELTGQRRAPLSLRIAQRFRMLQAVNHLRIITPDGQEHPLSDAQRQRLIDALSCEGDLKFTEIRSKRVLGLPRGTTFNLERGGEKRLCGHRIDAALRKIFGPERYDAMPESEKDAVVEDLRSIRSEAALHRRAVNRWGLDPEAATALTQLTLEESRLGLSTAAIRQLLPEMEAGVPYSTARKLKFPESFTASEPVDLLPPVSEWDRDLRNPAVARALTETRKLVNAIIRRFGKPDCIRIELARDLKQSRSRRAEAAQRMREREAQRERAKQRIIQEAGIAQPTRADIEKVMLADECNWQCPFTGRCFGMRELLGPQPQFDFEHIWPMSRSLDNSLLNRTICYHEENRDRKRGHTPFEAYSGTPERYSQILQRVREFKCDPFTRREKVRRFEAQTIDEDFTNRHLSDTRYIAARAAEYLGTLYGGVVDADGKRRVQVSSGGATAWLRREWGLDKVLGNDGGKNRQDHRHHAIDALIVALTDPGRIQQLARAAEEAERLGRRRLFESTPLPWERFLSDVAEAIDAIRVSHRQERKVRGKLHNESIYSRPLGQDGHHHIRKELRKLTRDEIQRDAIVDPRARQLIREKLAELKQEDPARAFADESNLPLIKGPDGRLVRLRKVRVRVKDKPAPFGRSDSMRYALPASNHHTVILRTRDRRGNEVWTDQPIRLCDLMDRKRPEGAGKLGPEVVFTLAANDYVEMDAPEGGTQLYRIRSVSEGDIELRVHYDARPDKVVRKAGRSGLRVNGEALRKRHARKVRVTYLGEVLNAGG